MVLGARVATYLIDAREQESYAAGVRADKDSYFDDENWNIEVKPMTKKICKGGAS